MPQWCWGWGQKLCVDTNSSHVTMVMEVGPKVLRGHKLLPCHTSMWMGPKALMWMQQATPNTASMKLLCVPPWKHVSISLLLWYTTRECLLHVFVVALSRVCVCVCYGECICLCVCVCVWVLMYTTQAYLHCYGDPWICERCVWGNHPWHTAVSGYFVSMTLLPISGSS